MAALAKTVALANKGMLVMVLVLVGVMEREGMLVEALVVQVEALVVQVEALVMVVVGELVVASVAGLVVMQVEAWMVGELVVVSS
ncbi:hypothetical protein ACFX15_017218 [Malus domestica]